MLPAKAKARAAIALDSIDTPASRNLYGCILPPIVVALIAVGHLRLDVHGMGAVVLVHAIWFVTVGIQLCRREPQIATP